jgi:antitoxin CptB
MRAEEHELSVARKRLKFRSWHRGTREMDLLLGRFADRHLDSFDAKLLAAYAALLEESDPDIYDWVCGRGVAPDGRFAAALATLARFHNEASKSC